MQRFRVVVTSLILVLLSVSAEAQENLSGLLRDQFTRYQENALQEKIFVHTSKDNYFIRETVFFKIYAVDGMLHQPLNLSTVAYVEMLNGNNQPVAQIKVPLKNGIGESSLILPDSLTTGWYRIITYTSWMKNFSKDYFFTKDISIVNPLKKIGAGKKVTNMKPVIRFFPEGGNLVYGLNSKVAFQVINSSGQGLDFKGTIVDEHNDTLFRFRPLKFGIGNFSFTPQMGKSYRACIQTTEGDIIKELPVPNDNGYVMTVRAEENDIEISVQSNKEGTVGREVFLFVHNRQRIRKLIAAVISSSGNTQVAIPTLAMDDGISHITLFDHELKPIAERLYFKQPEGLLKIKTDQIKPSYNKRELVSLTVTTEGQSNKVIPANLSMTVFKVDGIQEYDSTSIVSHLYLTSDLKGNIENPFYYVTKGGNEKKQVIDNLMLTHGWSRFNWGDVMKDNWPLVQFSPETEGMNVRALITNEQDAPLANASVFLSTPAKEIQFYSARSNARGLLQFYTRDLYGKNEVMFQQVGDTSKFNITLQSPFSENYPSRLFRPFNVTKAQEKLIRSYNIHSQIEEIYTITPPVSIAIDSVPFFGKPDKSYLLSDYASFPQFLDVLKEYVFEVIVRKQGDKFKIFVLDNGSNAFFENEPFVLLDGVPVFDTDRIVTQPASNIKRMEVINRKFFHGLFVFNGIISLTSNANNTFSGVEMNPEAVVFDYEGLQRSKEFYLPLYETKQAKEDRSPDFRNVLFWAPDINTDATGKSTVTFSTSDLPGKYIGVINGLTRDGLPGTATFTIDVE